MHERTHAHPSARPHAPTHIHTHTHTHTHTDTHTDTDTDTDTDTHTHTHKHTHTHTHARTHTHTHSHTLTLSDSHAQASANAHTHPYTHRDARTHHARTHAQLLNAIVETNLIKRCERVYGGKLPKAYYGRGRTAEDEAELARPVPQLHTPEDTLLIRRARKLQVLCHELILLSQA